MTDQPYEKTTVEAGYTETEAEATLEEVLNPDDNGEEEAEDEGGSGDLEDEPEE